MTEEICFWYGDDRIWQMDFIMEDKYIFLHLLQHLDIKYHLNTPEDPEVEFDFEMTRKDLGQIEKFFRFQFPGGYYPFNELMRLEAEKKNKQITRQKYLEKLEKMGIN